MTRQHLFSVTKKDLRVDTFRAGGKGGQNQNKRDTGVRITHVESGAVGEARDNRTQEKNKRAAFRRMLETTKWRLWFNQKIFEVTQEVSIEDRVNRMMHDIQIEQREDGEWVTV